MHCACACQPDTTGHIRPLAMGKVRAGHLLAGHKFTKPGLAGAVHPQSPCARGAQLQPSHARVAAARAAGITAAALPISPHLAAPAHCTPRPMRACTCHCHYGDGGAFA